jgi:hypothetical protein
MTDLLPASAYPLLTHQEPRRFATAFAALASTKGGKTDLLKQESYFQTLGELPIDAVEQAAKDLQREASPFLPDAGTWFTRADTIAITNWETSLKAHIPAPREVERIEVKRLRAAQRGFVTELRKYVTKETADAMYKRLLTTEVPTYACQHCCDVGWVNIPSQASEIRRLGYDPHRVARCACFSSNPVLERARAARKRHA